MLDVLTLSQAPKYIYKFGVLWEYVLDEMERIQKPMLMI